jgi:iron complex transport system substrate-binding protein
MRIVSLVPGATEVIATLGLADQLVGISHECDYPVEIRHVPMLIQARLAAEAATSAEIDRQVQEASSAGTDLYILDAEALAHARPELIITQELCHVCAITPDQVRDALRQLSPPPLLLSLQPSTLAEVLEDIERIGVAVGQGAAAAALASALRQRLASVAAGVSERARLAVACLEWLDPPYIAGHWVPEMIAYAGATDVLGRAGVKSRRAGWEEIVVASPEMLILAPCGFAIERTLREMPTVVGRPEWDALPAVRQDRVFAVDAAAYFSRPGPRLVEGVEILARLLHPEVFGTGLPRGAAQVISKKAEV